MRWGESPFLLVAGLLHLALPVAAAIAPTRDHGVAYVPITAQEIAIDTVSLPEVQADPLPQPREPYRVAARSHNEIPRMDRRVPRVEPTVNPSAQPSEKNLVPKKGSEGLLTAKPGTEPGGNDDMARAPVDGNMTPRIPGLPGSRPLWKTNPGLVPDDGPGSAAPTKPRKRQYDKKAATKAITKGVRKKDSRLGLDLPAASAIAAVLRNAVRASDAPYVCRGSFAVSLSAGGKVTAVNLLGFSGGSSSTWQHVRKSALGQLRPRKFPMKTAFAKGAVVSVNVRSQKKMPGGGASRKGASLNFDVTDIGAKPTRVVTAGFSATPVK